MRPQPSATHFSGHHAPFSCAICVPYLLRETSRNSLPQMEAEVVTLLLDSAFRCSERTSDFATRQVRILPGAPLFSQLIDALGASSLMSRSDSWSVPGR